MLYALSSHLLMGERGPNLLRKISHERSEPMCHCPICALTCYATSTLVQHLATPCIVSDIFSKASVSHTHVVIINKASGCLVHNDIWVAPMVYESIAFLMHGSCRLLIGQISIRTSMYHILSHMVGYTALVILYRIGGLGPDDACRAILLHTKGHVRILESPPTILHPNQGIYTALLDLKKRHLLEINLYFAHTPTHPIPQEMSLAGSELVLSPPPPIPQDM